MPSSSIALEPAIRELEASINQLARLILSNPLWVLLAINCFSIAPKPLASICLSNLPAFFELFKKSLFHPVFLALCGSPARREPLFWLAIQTLFCIQAFNIGLVIPSLCAAAYLEMRTSGSPSFPFIYVFKDHSIALSLSSRE